MRTWNVSQIEDLSIFQREQYGLLNCTFFEDWEGFGGGGNFGGGGDFSDLCGGGSIFDFCMNKALQFRLDLKNVIFSMTPSLLYLFRE